MAAMDKLRPTKLCDVLIQWWATTVLVRPSRWTTVCGTSFPYWSSSFDFGAPTLTVTLTNSDLHQAQPR